MPQEPTEYEEELMRMLGFEKHEDLLEFLSHPSWGCPNLHPPGELSPDLESL